MPKRSLDPVSDKNLPYVTLERLLGRTGQLSSQEKISPMIRAFISLVLSLALSLLLSISLSLSQTALAQQQPAPESAPVSTVGVKPTADDRAIKKRLQEIFDQLEGLESVEITVDAGVVMLRGEVPSAQVSEQATRTARRLEDVVEVNDELQETRDVRRRLRPTVTKLQGYVDDFVRYLPLLALALGVVAAFGFLGRWVAGWHSLFQRLAPNPFIRELLQQLVKVAIFLLGALLALDLLDATRAVGTVLGAAGLISLAVSFALRDTVENYITSILLSVRQPFAPNDHVVIESYEGRVVRLTPRATILLTQNGDMVRIPNATVFKAIIVNHSRNPLRRFQFIVGVALNTDLLAAQQLALETLGAMEGVLHEPSPTCLIHELGDYSIKLSVAGWIHQNQADFLKVKSEAIRLVTQAFATAAIDVPDPTYNIRLQRKPALTQTKPTIQTKPHKVAIDISRDEDFRGRLHQIWPGDHALASLAGPRWSV